MMNRSFAKLMLVYIFWLSSWAIAGSMFEVYFFDIGLSINEIFFSGIFWFITTPFLIPFIKRFESRKFMLIGTLIPIFSIALIYFFPMPEMAYIFRFIIGLTHVFFWIPFNIAYYEFRKGNNAVLGAVYYSIMPLLSLVLPAFAGFIAAGFGYQKLYLLSILLYVFTFLLAFFLLQKHTYKYSFHSSINSVSGLSSLLFLEGFSAAVIISVTLEAMLLLYVNKPFEFGSFISLVTVFSVAASFLTARVSDKKQSRRAFLIFSAAALALAVVFTSQTGGVITFFFGFGLIMFFRAIFFPLTLALVVDNSISLVEAMIGREFFLSLGKLFGAAITYVILINSNIQTALLFQGTALVLYIPLFEMKKRKLAKS